MAFLPEGKLARGDELWILEPRGILEAKSQESSLGYLNSQASDTSQLVSQASFNGSGSTGVTNSNAIHDDDDKSKTANSGTSKEHSDDDGDLEENTDPANAKRTRSFGVKNNDVLLQVYLTQFVLLLLLLSKATGQIPASQMKQFLC
ncbi:hypothetical protein E2562_023638 [Oryza meyeriana var. granulata]|uniref:Uncharacterized protein n=1 Tax=Oryza meyeriana var. granulata TaxID=110450 RepID=A0A6G1BLW4_9ORYZ|nr:hypothetical protein E2562_023638 [Oryza meyeriana var. granulata]